MTDARVLPATAARDWDFPRSGAGVRHLVRYAVGQGITAQRLLLGTGLAPDDLADPGLVVTAAQELRAVRTLRHLVPGAAAAVGATYTAESFGAMGWALLRSRTVAEAIEVALRFIDLSFAFALPVAEVVDEEVVAVLDGSALPSDVRGFLVTRDAVAVHRVLEDLVPGGVGARLELEPEPSTGEPVRAVLRFGVGELDRPLPRRDARERALAEQVCADVVGRRRARAGLPEDVRVLITQQLADGAPMTEVASALGMGERTLRRRLTQEGTSYRALLDEVRSALAADLLAARLPVADVAARLGYAESAALAHARRRWARG